MKKLILVSAAVAALSGCMATSHGDVVALKKKGIELELAKEKSRQAEVEADAARERAEIEAKKARELAETDAWKRRELAKIEEKKALAIAEEQKKIEGLKTERERLKVQLLENLKQRYAGLLDTNTVEALDFQSEIAWAEKVFIDDFGEVANDTYSVSSRKRETMLRAEYIRLLRTQRDGASITQEDWTNLVVGAVAVGRVNVLKWAFPRVKDIDIFSNLDPLRRAPILWALDGQNVEMLDVVWKSHPNVDVRDASGATPLHYAMRRGSQLDVERCLALNRELVKVADANGETPLYCAIAMSRLDLAQKLLNAQAKVQVQRKDGLSPFAYACARGELAFLELLERHGAKPSTQDFVKAIESGHLDIVKWFVEKHHFSVNDDSVRKIAAEQTTDQKVRAYLQKRGAAI